MTELVEALTAAQKLGLVGWVGLVSVLLLVNTTIVLKWALREFKQKKNGNGFFGRRETDGLPGNPHGHQEIILSKCAEHSDQMTQLRAALADLEDKVDLQNRDIWREINKQGKKCAVLWGDRPDP